MSDHTPEPWKYIQSGQMIFAKCVGGCGQRDSEFRLADVRGWGHLQYRKDGEQMQDANGKRIVSCVNALAGLNPEAVNGVVEALKQALPILEWASRGQYPKARAALAALRKDK